MKIFYSIGILIVLAPATVHSSEQSNPHCINKTLGDADQRPALYAAINDCIKNRNHKRLIQVFACNQPGQKNYQQAAGMAEETYNKDGIDGLLKLQDYVKKLFHNQEHTLLLNSHPLTVAEKYNDHEIIKLYKPALLSKKQID